MSFTSMNEQQIKQLKKFAFLYVGNDEQATEIIQKSIQGCAKKIVQVPDKEANVLLRNEVIRQCRLYAKKFNYKKDSFLKALGVKWYGAPLTGWRSINKLPTAMREVVIGHYVLNLSQVELAKSLQIPPGHVTGFINSAKKKLMLQNEKDEQKFIHSLMVDLQFIDMEELDLELLQFLPQPQKTKKKWYIGIAVVAVATILISAYIIFKNNDNQNEIAQPIEETSNQNQDDKEKKQPVVVPVATLPKEADELTIKLAAYKLFYNATNFFTATEAKIRAAENIYWNDTTVKYANDRNIFITEYDREKSKGNIKNSYYYYGSEFLQNTLKALDITEEEFIEHSLYEEEQFFYTSKMYDLNVDQNPLHELLAQENVPEEYYIKAGLTLDEVKEFYANYEELHFVVVTEPQFDLPFDLTGSILNVIQLENGDYVFENPTYFGLGETKYSKFYETYVYNRNPIPVTRTTLDDMIDYLVNFDTDYPPNKQLANELVEVYKLLEKSIEWELY